MHSFPIQLSCLDFRITLIILKSFQTILTHPIKSMLGSSNQSTFTHCFTHYSGMEFFWKPKVVLASFRWHPITMTNPTVSLFHCLLSTEKHQELNNIVISHIIVSFHLDNVHSLFWFLLVASHHNMQLNCFIVSFLADIYQESLNKNYSEINSQFYLLLLF